MSEARMMQAARLHAYGNAGSLRCDTAPMPTPGAGEVLVRVHAAGVTPTELLWVPTSTTRAGTPRPLPLILGHEFSGEVVELGDGVSGLAVGDAVYGLNDWFRDGASAEYCVATAATVAHKPASLDHLQAAAVPIAGLTAWQGLFDRGALAGGQRVLIHGAAGAVGVFAVQLAHACGAYVMTTVSAHNAEFVRGLGADETIDYQTVRFEDVARDVDVVFDGVGGETLARSQSVLKAGGRLVTIAASSEGTGTTANHAAFFIVEANAAQLAELARRIDAGTLRPVVDATFPLTAARAAYEHRPRHGKAVLQVVAD